MLNAIQQLGGGIGVAVLGTIFFTVLGHEGFAPALTHTIWWQVGLLGAMLALSPLLPARAREPEPARVDGDRRPVRPTPGAARGAGSLQLKPRPRRARRAGRG